MDLNSILSAVPLGRENAIGSAKIEGPWHFLLASSQQRRPALTATTITDPHAFIRANTRLRPVPLVPEIAVFVADESVPMWQKTEDELNDVAFHRPSGLLPGPGGQALARFVLDHLDTVRGGHVLDLASGAGLVGIAAMKAGAAEVTVADIDAFAITAAELNADSTK